MITYPPPRFQWVKWLALGSVMFAGFCIAALVAHAPLQTDIPLGASPTECYEYCNVRIDGCMRFCMRRPNEVSECCAACFVQSEVCRDLCDKSARPPARRLDKDAGFIL